MPKRKAEETQQDPFASPGDQISTIPNKNQKTQGDPTICSRNLNATIIGPFQATISLFLGKHSLNQSSPSSDSLSDTDHPTDTSLYSTSEAASSASSAASAASSSASSSASAASSSASSSASAASSSTSSASSSDNDSEENIDNIRTPLNKEEIISYLNQSIFNKDSFETTELPESWTELLKILLLENQKSYPLLISEISKLLNIYRDQEEPKSHVIEKLQAFTKFTYGFFLLKQLDKLDLEKFLLDPSSINQTKPQTFETREELKEAIRDAKLEPKPISYKEELGNILKSSRSEILSYLTQESVINLTTYHNPHIWKTEEEQEELSRQADQEVAKITSTKHPEKIKKTPEKSQIEIFTRNFPDLEDPIFAAMFEPKRSQPIDAGAGAFASAAGAGAFASAAGAGAFASAAGAGAFASAAGAGAFAGAAGAGAFAGAGSLAPAPPRTPSPGR
jgi:hypothetical protein